MFPQSMWLRRHKSWVHSNDSAIVFKEHTRKITLKNLIADYYCDDNKKKKRIGLYTLKKMALWGTVNNYRIIKNANKYNFIS